MVGAARGVPLRSQRVEARLHRLRKSEHQRPARRDLYLVDLDRHIVCQFRVLEQFAGLPGGYGEQHVVKAAKDLATMAVGSLGANGMQLPASGAARCPLNTGDAGFAF